MKCWTVILMRSNTIHSQMMIIIMTYRVSVVSVMTNTTPRQSDVMQVTALLEYLDLYASFVFACLAI